MAACSPVARRGVLALATLFLGRPALADKDRVLRAGRVTVGIYNQAPWGFRSAEGEVRGFDVDVIRTVMAPLGVRTLEFVVTQFPALIPGLQAARYDIATGGLYITPERCRLVAFSDTTLRMPDAAIVRAGNPKNIRSYADIAARSDVIFGATRGSITARNAEAAGVPRDRMMLFQDNASTLSALMAGRVDVQVSTAGAVIALLGDPRSQGLERVMPFRGHIGADGQEIFGNVAVAFRQEDADLRDAFNVELARAKADGRLRPIMERYGFGESETAAPLTQAQLCAA